MPREKSMLGDGIIPMSTISILNYSGNPKLYVHYRIMNVFIEGFKITTKKHYRSQSLSPYIIIFVLLLFLPLNNAMTKKRIKL